MNFPIENIYLFPAFGFFIWGLSILIHKQSSREQSYPWLVSSIISLGIYFGSYYLYPIYSKVQPPKETGHFLNDIIAVCAQSVVEQAFRIIEPIFYGVISLIVTWVVTWLLIKTIKKHA